jgi:hypothetical protein
MMTMHDNFADWYRSASIVPPEGLLKSRWAGVQDICKQPDLTLLMSLAKLFTLPNSTESAIPSGFREAFKKHDDNFSPRNNLQEVRVLAGAALRMVIEQNQYPQSPLAALAIVCGLFGPREALAPEREHLETAQRFLVKYSKETRETVAPTPIKIPSFTKLQFNDTFPPSHFSVHQTPNLQQPLVNSLNALADTMAGLFSALKQSQKSIEQLTHASNVREEEVAILWWLQGRFSRDLQKSFSDLSYSAGSIVFPMELADLTKFLPGSETIIAVLVHSLHLAGAPSSSESITIANAVNATPREWREKTCAKYKVDSTGLLSPLLLAMHKSLETEGRDEWFPVYRRVSDIPIDKPFPLIQLSLQLFRERMLLRASEEDAE